ncbi:hypothetical protein ANCCEY_14298 [Ancylostoma ceylanicum]|uniref:non-specific protein-tyrosine kinase n=3 Tax=Ancylostoma ceylanicum TaxID=53326 RepID=A0A016W8L6_9BILA|nr:hypothetical protein ANCCEY_14298 [Ancylostoma ceylanicum]EYC35353.1 hypothetical protein Y032_1073g3544 [Ancylostoma ceylanicum]
MSNPITGASVEKNLVDVCNLAKIEAFLHDLVFSLQIRRLDHISHVQDKELQAIGLSQSQIRDLRKAASEFQDRTNGTNTRSELVYVKNENLIQSNSADLNKVIIPKEQIKLMETIGEGTFSIVKRALWYHPSGVKRDVAVKILRDISPSLVEDLQVEASHLLKLQHSNLIRMYGIVQQPAMMVSFGSSSQFRLEGDLLEAALAHTDTHQ